MVRRLDPELAAEVMRRAGLEPMEPYRQALSPWLCRCTKCGKQTSPTLARIKSGRGPCKWCAPNCPVDPEAARAAMLAAQFEPLEPYPGRNSRPWLCRCLACDSEVSPRYDWIQQGRRGCPTCKSTALRSLRLTPEDRAVCEMRGAGVEPLVPYPGANHAWRSRCTKCGKETSSTLTKIRSGRGACRWCAPNAPLNPEVARAVMLAAQLEPLVVFPGANTRWLCRCLKCDTQVAPTYLTVKAGSGCRSCHTRGGFKPAQPAIVYLILNEALSAIKVGIGHREGDRLDRHRKNGWAVIAEDRASGELAVEIERHILGWWRGELGLPPYLSAAEMPYRGWTETVDADVVDIPATVERMKRLALGVTPTHA